jgi:transcription elongation factor Elf1
MGNHRAIVKVFKKSDVQKMPLKRKPACPYCGKPLTFVYSDVEKGHLGQKCGKCGKPSMLDMETMEVYQIRDDSVRM